MRGGIHVAGDAPEIYIAGELGAPRTARLRHYIPARAASTSERRPSLLHRHDERGRRRGARAAGGQRDQARGSALAHITWVLQPGPATLVRGHPAVDEIVRFDRVARLARVHATCGASCRGRAVRRRARAAGLLQGRHRHGVRARAREARLRSCARARPQLAVHEPSASRRTQPQHIQDQYFEFLERARHHPHEPVEWDLGPWDDGARVAARVHRRSSIGRSRRSSSARASRRRTGSPSDGRELARRAERATSGCSRCSSAAARRARRRRSA